MILGRLHIGWFSQGVTRLPGADRLSLPEDEASIYRIHAIWGFDAADFAVISVIEMAFQGV